MKKPPGTCFHLLVLRPENNRSKGGNWRRYFTSKIRHASFSSKLIQKIVKEKLFKRILQLGYGEGTWVCSADKSVIRHRNNKVGLFARDLYEDNFFK